MPRQFTSDCLKRTEGQAGPAREKIKCIAPTVSGLLLMITCSGCLDHLRTPERLDRGLVIVLPGIEGPSVWNQDILLGLESGCVDCGIERFNWGTSIPGGMLINLTDYAGNRRRATDLRDRIMRYWSDYPGRPVHLVGHSGGGGLAVLAAEQLPDDLKLSSITLLAVALTSDYDLRPAMRRTEHGIFNFYSKNDDVFLGYGTNLMGNIDRGMGRSAGRIGFTVPPGISQADRELYRSKLEQIAWTPDMRVVGNDGGHFGCTNRYFVAATVAPIINRCREINQQE